MHTNDHDYLLILGRHVYICYVIISWKINSEFNGVEQLVHSAVGIIE